MCSIAGIVKTSNSTLLSPVSTLAVVRKMNSLLAHRGPDADGIHQCGDAVLGHRRLAILDLSAGANQPFISDDGRVVLVYNGESYNYLELRRELQKKGHTFRTTSDTEVVLHLYLQYGTGFLNKLRGMFAFAIWDDRTRELLLVRDRLGIKPLYYTQSEGHFAFASELKALLAVPGINLELDQSAFFQYLNLLSVPLPQTIYRSCRKLEPGCMLRWCDGKSQTEAYWRLSDHISSDERTSNIEEFRDRFNEIVNSHMIADVEVGAFLSGGLDSSFVCKLASEHSTHPLQTFSAGFDDIGYDESALASIVARDIGAKHRKVPIKPDLVALLPRLAWHMDEPFGVISALPTYVLAGEASRHLKVVLTGDGADEVLGGYPWRHCAELPLRRWDFLPAIIRNLVEMVSFGIDALGPKNGPAGYTAIRQAIRYARLTPGLCYSGFLRYIDEESLFSVLRRGAWRANRHAWQENRIAALYNHVDTECSIDRKLYVDVMTSLVDEMLTKVDRTTMAHGLEARVPFLDHTWVEYCFSLPCDCKVQGRTGKLVLRDAVRRTLPEGISDLPKHGFNVPIDQWLRGELRDFISDNLLSESFLAHSWIDRNGLIRMIDRHNRNDADYGIFLYSLLCYALWEKSQEEILHFCRN